MDTGLGTLSSGQVQALVCLQGVTGPAAAAGGGEELSISVSSHASAACASPRAAGLVSGGGAAVG